MAAIDDLLIPSLTLDEVAAPSTPAATSVVIYAKADGLVYSKDDAGTETLMSSGLASSTSSPPTFVAAGVSASGTGDVTPGLPTGHTTNDILLLFVQTNQQGASAPAGYARLGPAVGIGTAAAAGGVRGYVFWKRDAGSESDPTVTDTGDHTLAQIIAIRGCPTSGDPFRSVGQTRKATASTTGTGVAGATAVDNALVVQAFFHALDSASAVFSGWTNASLTSVTERIDVATADGNGGGIGVATGVLATAGSFDATTVTETSTTDVGTCFYMLPAGFVSKGEMIDRQVFLTPGFTDTWTKPSGAKVVDIMGVSGGASGSAGRNAATAAGGGGGGGGGWKQTRHYAGDLPSTINAIVGAGGAATAHTDGAASNAGGATQATFGSTTYLLSLGGGGAAGASSSGSGGTGGNGSGSAAGAPSASVFGSQAPGGGTGGTTAGTGGSSADFAGGAGAGGGTTQATSAGGSAIFGAGGGGGGRSNTNVGTGGPSNFGAGVAGGATAGANGGDSLVIGYGGSGAAGGTSAVAAGAGGWPGGGGGGGGTASGAQGGGKGGDGVLVITTHC